MMNGQRAFLYAMAAVALFSGCCPTAPPHVCVEVTARTFKKTRDSHLFLIRKIGDCGAVEKVRFSWHGHPARASQGHLGPGNKGLTRPRWP